MFHCDIEALSGPGLRSGRLRSKNAAFEFALLNPLRSSWSSMDRLHLQNNKLAGSLPCAMSSWSNSECTEIARHPQLR